MSDTALLRIGILAAGLLLIAAIFLFGRPKKKPQGRRVEGAEPTSGQRREPVLGDDGVPVADGRIEPGMGGEGEQAELGLPDTDLGAASDLGKRATQDFDKIVSLLVAARAGEQLRGEDIVVAAEKTGLVFGHMNVFHRLVEGYPERGPIFSMASVINPGSFDMANIRAMETPAIAFFLTLPAPLTALDAWEKMLPTVQRMAELLDGVVLDDGRNALGRQRIAHIRDELRAYDRQHQAPPLTKTPRW
ncbi:cell division protein ZipA [Stenotrophomonas maltophilia]|uniref:cell division protein ZipA n=1 Tax=Stenotrophomonas TaxID=40323 RepID=UPI00062D922D|nr:cell division protein ZipA [Stenotrophomonas maltophilia]TIE21166.1 cell division protein ZipA [Stenotrophomonas maltophilia]TIE64323.1 cell division protein ZipA [Stenotrophomonas maltophilia]HEL2957577.1 cell division protein ZipA [Stenotrophomonas maltophilia]HEL4234511.1 cell division protein ZipA [Stenotrophomonas maltophilia]HEL7749256.1 cell division protein ZipA [Stenotrophomonas maltophilia]